MSSWKQRVYEKNHPSHQPAARDLAAELNTTIRCIRYQDKEHRKDSLQHLVGRFGVEEQRILLGKP